MRIIKLSFFLLVYIIIFNSCDRPVSPLSLEAINAYIENVVNNRKNDIRMYDPPPPPEWKDSLKHNGRMKPDSILKNSKPLKRYINLEVKYDSIINADIEPIKDFNFINNITLSKDRILLTKKSFSQKEGIILEFINKKDFFLKYTQIQYNENYGGFISFKNLYYSKDGKKAFFEVLFYKSRLNSSSSIIYAEKQSDGTWKFQSDLLSVS